VANQTELEELVVRLTGEASGYLKMLTEAQQKTKETADKIEKEAGKIEKFKETVEGFQKKAISALKVIGIGASLEAAVDKFDKVELASKRMEATLEANGREVTKTTDDYTKFAKEMAKVSDVSKGTTLNMLQQAEMMGLTGEKAKQAVKNAMSMAAMKGVDDPSQFLRHMVLFSQGKDARLAAMLGIGSEMEDDGGKHQEIQERLNKGMAMVKIAGSTSEAAISRAKAAMGSIVTEVGGTVSPYVDKFAETLEKLANKFKELPGWIRAAIVSFTLFVAVIEPASMALSFMTARFVAFKTIMSGLPVFLMDFAMNLGRSVAAFQAMSAASKVASMAVTGGLIVAFAALTMTLVGLYKAQAAFNEELKKSGELAEGFRNIQSKKDAPGLAMVQNAEGLDERRRVAKPLLDAKNKEVEEAEKAFNRAKERLAKVDEETSTRRIGGGIHFGKDAGWFGGGDQQKFDKAQQEVEERKKALEQAKGVQEQLKNALQIDPKAIEDLDKLIDRHKEKAITAGMTADQLELYNAQKKLGEDHPMLNALRENQQLAEQAKKTADATKTVQDYIEQTQLKIATDGMSADEMVLYKAKLDNVDEALIKQAKDLASTSKAQEQYTKFLEEGRQMTLEFLTPLEKFEDRTKAIIEQFEAGNIDDFTFFAAMNKARDDLDEATNAAEKAESAITAVNQAMAGGADANSRLFNYRASLEGAQEATTNKFLGRDVSGNSTRPVVNKLDELKVLLARIADRENNGIDFDGADL